MSASSRDENVPRTAASRGEGATAASVDPVLWTVGHGTLTSDALAGLLRGVGIRRVIDVRSAPGSRRHPQFRHEELAAWLPAAGIAYAWEPRLGGFRRARPDSEHVALRHPSFRGYADHMSSSEFVSALHEAASLAREEPTTVMCAEALWWRCHRRLIADAAVLSLGVPVLHLGHDGREAPHRLTEGVRVLDGRLVYDGGQQPLPTADPSSRPSDS